MTAKYLLAIDAGTSGVHCLIVDFKGRLISRSHQDWEYSSPPDIAPLGKEFAPDAFWRTICATMNQAFRGGGIEAKDITSVSATSQREGVVFLDKEGRELYAGPNIDIRALTEGLTIDAEFNHEVYAITGHKPYFLFVPSKLRWFKANNPGIYRRIATVLTISDWIIYRLSGECVAEVSGASELGLADIQSRNWSERLPQLLELPDSIYPELVPAGSRVGKLTHQAADDTGLPESTLVAQGAPDAQCGLLGMGVKDRGQIGIILGWSAPVQMALDRPVIDFEARTWTSCHLFPERWVLESNAGEAGSVYRWLKDTMFDSSGGEAAFDLMGKMALEIPQGAEGVMAFIGPSAMNMNRLGLRYGGLLFPVPTSVTNVSRAHLVRASLENLSYAIKANCLQLEAVSGVKIKGVAIGGGMLRNQCLTQILPAVLGVPVLASEIDQVSALGAAICAAAGAGAYSSLEEAMKAMSPKMRELELDRLAAFEYAEHYQTWAGVAQSLEKLSENMK
jgi:sugar (pentulose or hexulose) kinase